MESTFSKEQPRGVKYPIPVQECNRDSESLKPSIEALRQKVERFDKRLSLLIMDLRSPMAEERRSNEVDREELRAVKCVECRIKRGPHVCSDSFCQSFKQAESSRESSKTHANVSKETLDTLKYVPYTDQKAVAAQQLRIDTLQDHVINLQDSIQQFNHLNEQVSMHEDLLKIANDQTKMQQELMQTLCDAQFSTAHQVSSMADQLTRLELRAQLTQKGQLDENDSQHPESVTGRSSRATDISGFDFLSDEEASCQTALGSSF